MLDSAYKGSLLKDGSVKKSADYGSPGAIQDGQVMRVNGFDLYPNPRIPANGESPERVRGLSVRRPVRDGCGYSDARRAGAACGLRNRRRA